MGKWKTSYDGQRKYNKSWEELYPWLACLEDTAYCTVCHCTVKNKKNCLDLHERTKKHAKRIGQSVTAQDSSIEKPKIPNFVQAWEEEFPWLMNLDGSSYCKLCHSFLQNKKLSLISHEKTAKHAKKAAEEGQQENSYTLVSADSPGLPPDEDHEADEEQPDHAPIDVKEVVVSYGQSHSYKSHKIPKPRVWFRVMTSVTNR